MDTIFWICVKLMQVGANVLGITYQQLSVILFVIPHPALTIAFWHQYRRYKRKYRLALEGGTRKYKSIVNNN